MASDDDFYILLVDDSVGDAGTQVIDLKENNDIVNDIFKHFKSDIKQEDIEVTSEAQVYNTDELYVPENYDYNKTGSQSYETFSNLITPKQESDSDIDNLDDELDKLDDEEDKSKVLTSVEDYLISTSWLNLDDNEKIKVNKFIEAMVEHAEASPPPLPYIPYNVLGDQYDCILCSHMSKTEKAAIRHYRYRHGLKHHECLACHSTYRRHDTLLFHEQYCNKEESNLLRVARNIFNDKRDEKKLRMRSHRKREGKYVKVPCRMCSKLISRSNMKVHMEVHTQIRRYECTLCSASFRSNRALKSHMNYHNGEKPYQCDECPKAYSSYNGYLVHKKRHKSIFYECDLCEAKYVKKITLLEHRKKHLDEDTEQLCTKCGEVCPNKIKMQLHLKKHRTKPRRLNKNIKYKCSECSKICSSLTNVKYHMKTRHNAEIYSRRKFLKILPELNILAQVTEEEIVDEISNLDQFELL